jgi:hypothetical protein
MNDSLQKYYHKNIVNLVRSLYEIFLINQNKLYKLTGYSYLRNLLYKNRIEKELARCLYPNVDSLAFFCFDDDSVQLTFKLSDFESLITIDKDFCIYTRKNSDVVGYHLTNHFWEKHIDSFVMFILNDLLL